MRSMFGAKFEFYNVIITFLRVIQNAQKEQENHQENGA